MLFTIISGTEWDWNGYSQSVSILAISTNTYDVSIQRVKFRRQIVRARRRDVIHYYFWNWMGLKQVYSKCLITDYQYQHTYDVSIQRVKLRRQIVRARGRDIIHYYCWNWMEVKQVFSQCLNTGYQYQHADDVQDESHFHLKLTKT